MNYIATKVNTKNRVLSGKRGNKNLCYADDAVYFAELGLINYSTHLLGPQSIKKL